MNLILRQQKFGCYSEKMVYDGQLEMCFNEAEVTIVNKYVVEPDMEEVCQNHIKEKRQRVNVMRI